MSDNPYLLRLRGERAKLMTLLEPLEGGEPASRNTPQTQSRIHLLHRQLGDVDLSIRAEERRRGV